MSLEVVIDKSFDPTDLQKYHLSLKIGIDFFIVNAVKVKSGANIAIAEQNFKGEYRQDFHTSAFVEALKKAPIKVTKKYQSVSISIANTLFALIPKVLFDENLIKSYVELNCKTNENHDYRFNIIPDSGMVICYAIPRDLNNWLIKVFPKAKIIHELAISIEACVRDFKSFSENRLILNIHKNYFDFIYLKEGKVEFVNSFHFTEKEDFLYYLLYTCEQLEINPHEITTYLLGEIKKGEELHQLLFQYIKNLEFGSRNKNIKIAPELNGIPKHYFYNIFNQFLCG
tara:strand:- start:109 stop:963 length:855 start_codon:yes stop_codon:yes gene_type:complete